MNRLERPKFPPPPKAIVPPSGSLTVGRHSSVVGPARNGFAHVPAATGLPSYAADQEPATHSNSGSVSRSATSHDHPSLSQHPRLSEAERPFRMGIDSVGTLPHAPHTPVGPANGLPDVGRADAPAPAQPAIIPPAFGSSTRRSAGPVGPVRPVTGSVTPGRDVTGPLQRGGTPSGPAGPGRRAIPGRTPLTPGKEVVTPNPGRVPSGDGNGIVGGRPTVPPTARSIGAIPRGTVVGTEGPTAAARGPVGCPATGSGGPAPQPVGRAAGIPGGRTASPTRGVVGGTTQYSSRTGRPPAVGNANGSLNSGAPVRRGITGGAPTSKRSGNSSASATSRETSSAPSDRLPSPAATPGGRQAKEQRNRTDDRRSARPPAE
jgi:hypothetical protein